MHVVSDLDCGLPLGKQAIEKMYQKHYDAVVMDLVMPVLDGATATATIRSLEELNVANPRSRQLVIGTSGTVELEDHGKSSGMDHFVSKLDVKEVVRTVSLIVEGGKQISFPQNQDFKQRPKYSFVTTKSSKMVTFNEVVRVRTYKPPSSHDHEKLWWSIGHFHAFLLHVSLRVSLLFLLATQI